MGEKGKRTYPYELKEKIIKDYMNGGGSYREMSKKYNIPLKTISNLVARYKKTGIVEKRRIKSKDGQYKEKYEILKNFQAFLEQEHKKK